MSPQRRETLPYGHKPTRGQGWWWRILVGGMILGPLLLVAWLIVMRLLFV